MSSLEARIDRLESIDEIRQLVSKYALSLDMRDLDAHVNLFAEDIRISRDQSGRAALKSWLDDTLRLQFTGTSHHIGNHILDCLLYTSPSPRDLSTSRMPSSA